MSKKIFSLILFLFFVITAQFAKAETEEFFGIGAELMQDTSNKKIIVTEILNNTPAQKAGIKAGDEITAIDGKKIKGLTICEVISQIRGEENTKIELGIKRNLFKNNTFKLTRKKISISMNSNGTINNYWAKIAFPCYIEPKLFSKNAIKKFSKKHRNTIIALNNYWYKRKEVFKTEFNYCMNNSDKNNQENCLKELIKKESVKTDTDKASYKFLRN